MKIPFGSLYITVFIAVVTSAAFLGACTITTGNKISEEQVGQIEKGITTKADVNRMFGKPTSKTVDANGKEVWMYSFSEYKYIPGSRGRGRYDPHADRLLIFFTEDKVEYYRFTTQ